MPATTCVGGGSRALGDLAKLLFLHERPSCAHYALLVWLELQIPAPAIHEPNRQVDGSQHHHREQQGRGWRARHSREDVGVQGFSHDVHPRHIRQEPRYQIGRDRIQP